MSPFGCAWTEILVLAICCWICCVGCDMKGKVYRAEAGEEDVLVGEL